MLLDIAVDPLLSGRGRQTTHMKPEWRVPGRATGLLRLTLNLPALDTKNAWEFKGEHALVKLRRVVQPELVGAAASAMEDGTATISAEVRAAQLSVRWRVIARWRAGESVEAMLDRTRAVFDAIEKEEWPGLYEARFLPALKRRP
jgi:hypothetical protein